MKFYNANIFQPEAGFKHGSFEVENGIFSKVEFGEKSSNSGIDLNGALVIPGLIDLHTHGNSNTDFSDGDKKGLEAIAKYLIHNGITSFLPTSVTLPYDSLSKAFISAHEFTLEEHPDCANVIGIHMEGPYLSQKYKGAQNAEYLKLPDANSFNKLQVECGNLIKIVDVAPETKGAVEFIEEVSGKDDGPEKTLISLAHTDADYEVALNAFDSGARHVTHLFNGMAPMHHRNSGVIGAASDRDDVTVELICDGLHVHPSVVRMAFKIFSHRICLISDSIRCCGMPEGEYELGGQKVVLKSGEVRLADGTLAGSATNLFECMKKAISFGVPVTDAIAAATFTPAKCLHMENRIGVIKTGNDADFIVCNDGFDITNIYRKGSAL